MWAIFLGFGLIFGLVGLGLLALWALGDPSATVAGLPQPSARELAALPAGREVFVEGRIGALEQGLSGVVAFERAELQRSEFGGEESAEWTTVERRTPPLPLDTPGGRVELTNDDYTLLRPPLERTEPDGSRLRAFAVGDPVVVIGRSVGEGTPALSAQRLVGGTRDTYLAELGASDRSLLWIGLAALAFGLGFGLPGALGLWRRRRRSS